VYRQFTQDLPDTRDYAWHKTEIAVGSLPPEITCSSPAQMPTGTFPKHDMWQNLTVSNISFINQGDDYFVLNRESGQPLAGATVQAGNEGIIHRVKRQT